MRTVDLPPVHPPGPGPRPVTPSPASPSTPRWLPWAIGIQAVVVVGLIAGGFWWMRGSGPTPTPPPSPVADYDPAFVPVGKELAKRFAADFAESYEAGAKLFAAGQSRQAANDTVSHEFSAARQKTFDEVAAPALSKIVDQGKADDKITPEERIALTRALRGISKGAMP